MPDFSLSSSPSSIEVLQGGSGSVEKGKGIDYAELFGCDVGLDVDMFSEEDPTPLRSYPAIAKQNSAGTMPSDWVLHTVKEIRHSVV